MTAAFTFPGQGSQTVGMGKELAAAFPEARAVFDEVDAALGQKLSALMFDGPDDTLRLTENAQPALMAVSLAVVRVLASRGVSLKEHAAYVAGHSLGEYSALCAAGAFTLADTARLLRIRGQAMQQAVPVGQGAMAAILGLDLPTVERAAADASDGEVCAVANDNAPGQVVIAGTPDGIAAAGEQAKGSGVRRVLALDVGHAFHTPLLLDAAEALAPTLGEVTFHQPWAPVFTNTDAATDPKLHRFVPSTMLDQMLRRRAHWNLPEEYNFKALAESCAKIVRAGGKVCLGSHGEMQGVGAHWELWSLASGGMSPL